MKARLILMVLIELYSLAANAQSKFDSLYNLARKGNAAAQNEIGEIYYDAEEVVKNDTEAFKWFKLSADKGYLLGINSLAFMYFHGFGVKEDKEKPLVCIEKQL